MVPMNRPTFERLLVLTTVSLALAACGSDSPKEKGENTPSAPAAIGACNYTNPFSSSPECKLYSGTAWTVEAGSADCLKGPFGTPGTWQEDSTCQLDPILGECIVTPDDGLDYVLTVGGDDDRNCAAGAMACTAFAGGTFEASDKCVGYDRAPMSGEAAESTVFQWPTRTCKPALDGEPAGQTDGEVCTWNLISASTEENRHYVDYGDCSVVHTNRPYYPLDPWQVPPTDDPRLDDAVWLAESEWVQSQVRSGACVCCHSEDTTPSGPSRWSVDAGPLWVDTMSDEAVVLFAGHTDSSVLGAFDPADNNGFDRVNSALPTTDVDRMLAFFQGELERRNVTDDYIDGLPDVGGPLLLQLAYEPVACVEGEGVDADGRLIWNGGEARYLYVLEAGTQNPGLPPNFDLPDGTLWRADVAFDVAAFESGVVYGELPEGAVQRFPDGSAPEALTSGESYYLHVLRDVAIPIARCLFTAK